MIVTDEKALQFEAVIGLEIHAELATRSKMFCACPVVDNTTAAPNSAVCPVCAGMPGVLPVINKRAVAYALKVALALDCEIAPLSVFARKNYFYPDLPKGYQISQYEQPLAVNGRLAIRTRRGERIIRIRRVHLEEDTGKSTHVHPPVHPPETPDSGSDQVEASSAYSLIDLNRAGVPLLEIVTEPDMHTAEEVGAYARGLRAVLRYLGVNSGDMQKGVLRIEPNISVRQAGQAQLGTRTEVKNLNSFRALERAVDYEIRRQIELLQAGQSVSQETVGWDEALQATVSQRGKEEAHDYRYFPEPDLPPLVVEEAWIAELRASLPELPEARFHRYQEAFGLREADAEVLIADPEIGDYFEQVVLACPVVEPQTIANWITGELFSLLNQSGQTLEKIKVSPEDLGDLVQMVGRGDINQNTGKRVLAEMFASGEGPAAIVAAHGLQQISDAGSLQPLIDKVLAEHSEVVHAYFEGKESVLHWLFGQVMRRAKGRANPRVVRAELERSLDRLKGE